MNVTVENKIGQTTYSPFNSPDGTYLSKRNSLQDSQLKPAEALQPFLDEEIINEGIQWCANYLKELVDNKTLIMHNLKGAKYFYEYLQPFFPELSSAPIHVSTSNGYQSFGSVKENDLLWVSAEQLNGIEKVVVLEDINDTGRTLAYIVEKLVTLGIPRENIISVCLFEKMIDATVQHIPTVVLFKLIEAFYVGRGLDEGTDRFRELLTLCILKQTETT